MRVACIFSAILLLAVFCITPLFYPVVYAAELLEESNPSLEIIRDTETEVITEDTENVEEETTEPSVDQIPDDLYQSYVLGCLFFFVAVILFYFAYKFLKMFF